MSNRINIVKILEKEFNIKKNYSQNNLLTKNIKFKNKFSNKKPKIKKIIDLKESKDKDKTIKRRKKIRKNQTVILNKSWSFEIKKNILISNLEDIKQKLEIKKSQKIITPLKNKGKILTEKKTETKNFIEKNKKNYKKKSFKFKPIFTKI